MSNRRPSVLITGAAGLLGRELVRRFADEGWDVVAACRSVPDGTPRVIPYVAFELTDPDSVASLIRAHPTDWVVHAAALVDVDRCEREPEPAIRINHLGTGHLARTVAECGARLCYISTDYVFEGIDGPYREGDPTKPINVYGRTKLHGEAAVANALPPESFAIVRASGFLGWGHGRKTTFVGRMIETLRAGKTLRAPVDQLANVVPIADLAVVVEMLSRRNAAGTWHVAGDEIVSRLELALLVATILGLRQELVEPVAYADIGRDAARPLKGGLVVEKMKAELGSIIPGLETALRTMRDTEPS